MDIFHLTFTADRYSRLPLFSGEQTYREALRRIGRVARGQLILFALLDEHLHLVAQASREQARRLARATVRTLQPIVATPFAPTHIRSVDSRAHLQSLPPYLLRQPAHHRLPTHPALWTGSCFPDLVGARVVSGLELRIAEVLPRFRCSEIQPLVGLPPRAIVPADRVAVRAAGATRLVTAAAAALAVGPDLSGLDSLSVVAGRAVVELAVRAEIARPDLSWALGVSSRTLRRWAQTSVDPRVLHAVRMRIALENTAAADTRATTDGRKPPLDLARASRQAPLWNTERCDG